jgi:hypothetical protein
MRGVRGIADRGGLHPSSRHGQYWRCEDASALQRRPRAERGSVSDKEYGIVAYELQVIASVIANVLHDVTMGHPFGDH